MDNLSLRVVTFVASDNIRPEQLETLLAVDTDPLPKLLVISLQKLIDPLGLSWERAIHDLLLEKQYRTVQRSRLEGTFQGIYIHGRDLVNSLDVEGISNQSMAEDNSELVSTRFKVCDFDLRIISADFPERANFQKTRKNCAQMLKAIQEQDEHKTNPQLTIWSGNFALKINATRTEILNRVQSLDVENLVRYDQLNIVRIKHAMMAGYDEFPIEFNPTSTFRAGTDDYDTTKKPSWPSRVLTLTEEGSSIRMQNPSYFQLPNFRGNPHRPVVYTCNIIREKDAH